MIACSQFVLNAEGVGKGRLTIDASMFGQVTIGQEQVTESHILHTGSIVCVLGSSIPCFLRHSNEVNEGFARLQHVTQQVIVDIVPHCGDNACSLPDLQVAKSP